MLKSLFQRGPLRPRSSLTDDDSNIQAAYSCPHNEEIPWPSHAAHRGMGNRCRQSPFGGLTTCNSKAANVDLLRLLTKKFVGRSRQLRIPHHHYLCTKILLCTGVMVGGTGPLATPTVRVEMVGLRVTRTCSAHRGRPLRWFVSRLRRTLDSGQLRGSSIRTI